MTENMQTIPPMGQSENNNTHKIKPVMAVLVVTALLAFIMIKLKPKEQKKDDAKPIPAVEVIQVQPIDYVVPIYSEGTVLPQTKINVSAEVAGKIVFVADNFINGGTFAQGDVLLKIDPVDYQLAITRAKANVASQQANLDLQQAKSDLAKKDWKKYGKKGKPDALNLNLPQVDSAKAALSAAKADLQLAKRNLEKTVITAPFSGVILAKMVDLGQFVNLTTPLASLASTEVAEVRISLSDENMTLGGLNQFNAANTIPVDITSQEIPDVHWQGTVRSIEAQRDARTLFNYAIVEVNKPLSQQSKALRFNTFVNVALQGKTLQQVYPIERDFISLENQVKILSNDSKLTYKTVNIVYTDEQYKYASEGIDANDKIITTGLSHVKAGDTLTIAK
jgi:RND family efflux transporter MFP subunit